MNMKKASLVLMLTMLALGWAFAQDDYDQVSNMSFVVLKDYNGKPIRNAAVVLHPVNKEGRQEKGGLELKTNPDGKASYDGIPYGKLRVQALAPGFQTYGEDFEINQPKVAITIRMKRPQHQFSIYDDQENDQKPDSSQKKSEPQK
jgi:hypothetical protein